MISERTRRMAMAIGLEVSTDRFTMYMNPLYRPTFNTWAEVGELVVRSAQRSSGMYFPKGVWARYEEEIKEEVRRSVLENWARCVRNSGAIDPGPNMFHVPELAIEAPKW